MQQYIGMRLGAYQIIEQIGQGGMATVFQAYQPSMDRYVAIKILPSHFTEDAGFVGRFTQEARTLARLEHPHILPVHDYGEQEGITYLVMRYVEAGTLKDLITQEGPIELEEAARILGQVGGAVDYAHSQGVVHRDIKPSNVLIDQRGNTFLTDFGIAKLVAESAQFTASGAIIGTPAYMSPEQGMGQPVDHRSDIYSLGVVLYELVTGRVPFRAETPLAVLLKHVNDPLLPPRQIKPDLPPPVERVTLKALAKSPDDRFQSAQEMVDALGQAVVATTLEIASPLAAGAGEATTLIRSDRTPPPPAAETAQPAPVVEAAPLPPVADTAPPHSIEDAAPPPPAVDRSLPRLEPAAQARARRPLLLVAGGAILLGLLLIAGLLFVPGLFDGEATPTALSQAQETPVAVSQTQETPMVGDQPATGLPPAEPEQVQYHPGWTSYGNGNFVSALARQDNILWVGGESGLVRWDLADGSYDRFGTEDGLASSYINDLLVDDEGFLWIATDAGINRYDGETMMAYDEADGLDAPWILTLFQDNVGRLLAGSRGGERGLNYYDGQGWSLPPVPSLPLDYANVQALDGSEETGLFVGLEDQGLARYEGEAWLVLTSADGLPGDEVYDVLLADDSLWASFDTAMVRFDLETGDAETIPHGNIYAMHQAADGDLWFGGSWRALRFDPDTGDWQEFNTAPGPIPDSFVTAIAEGEEGLWFGTYGGGVALYDGSQWETRATDEDLGGNSIEAVRQDKDGAIWFTHPGTGLTRHDPADDAWQVFGAAEGALNWPTVPGVDSAGNLWAGDYGELVHFDGQAWESFTPSELAEVEIHGIDFGPGDVKWLVTGSGLMRHDPTTDEWTTFTAADHPIIDNIWSFLAASDGTLWLGGEEGLVGYDGESWSAPTASGNAPQFVSDIAEALDGSLWVAADGELGHLSGDKWSYFAWPSEGWLEVLTVGPDGSVWAGYDGLGHYDPASGGWQMFTTADGLVNSRVQAIHVSPEGVVWVGTEGGLSRYIPSD